MFPPKFDLVRCYITEKLGLVTSQKHCLVVVGWGLPANNSDANSQILLKFGSKVHYGLTE